MIGVFVESIQESIALLNRVKVGKSTKIGNAGFYPCMINETEFLVVETGYAKANVGSALGIALAEYDLTAIIGIGDCASLNPSVAQIGDVAISKKALEYDVNFCPLGFPIGRVPKVTAAEYHADETLVALAKDTAKALESLGVLGTFGSADTFLADCEIAHSLKNQFHLSFVDTECGAAGQLATAFCIPFIFVKGVSNYGDHNAPCDYKKYRQTAYEMASIVVYTMLDQLSTIEVTPCP